MTFVPFRNIETGNITYYPAHFADDPILSNGIELYDPEADDYEEDKVVLESHELPASQRVVKTATKVANDDKETK